MLPDNPSPEQTPHAAEGSPTEAQSRPDETNITLAGIATLVLDDRLRLRLATKAAGRYGIGPDDYGRPLSELAGGLPGAAFVAEETQRVLETLAPVEKEVVEREGGPHLLRVLPYRTAEGEVEGAVILIVDIQPLRQAESTLQEREEQYRLLVESAEEYAMFTMDADTRINMWNTGAERIMGYTEEEVRGRPGAIIFTPEDRAAGAVDEELRIAREEGQARNERWHLRKDGSRFWGMGMVTSLWQDGELRGYAKVMRDNTRRKEAREALEQSETRYRELSASLEERVQQRTTQVRRLAGELINAEQAERARLARALHDDLQQILYAAGMQLQFMREDLGESTELNELQQMVSQALRLTRQLSAELNPPLFQGHGLRQALNWLAGYMEESYRLQVTVHVPEGLPQLGESQRTLLFEVIRELLFNVVKHAEVSDAQVVVESADDGVNVTVADHGTGFDPDGIVPTGSSGFGLRSVRERLAFFGGRFTIESAPGAGTRVVVHLPAADGSAAGALLPGAQGPET